MRHGLLAALLLFAIGTTVASEPGGARVGIAQHTLTFEERVAAQRAVEEIYWRHRIWPKENTAPKPPLTAVLPDEMIGAKVEDYLKKSRALERFWGRAITPRELQAEIDRMVRDTRDGKTLEELFEALGNDPRLIAESLAGPALVNRLVRSWYARDPRFHDAVRRRAASALDGSTLRGIEQTWRLTAEDAAASPRGPDNRTIELSLDDWRTLSAELESQSIGSVGPLLEDDESFYAVEVVARGDDHLTTVTYSWPKVPFDDWWSSQRLELGTNPNLQDAEFTVTPPDTSGCAVDSWGKMRAGVPDARRYHTAVWTGSEMLVWGGEDRDEMSTGGRYDPATDTWTATAVGGDAPAARRFHKAIWTGTEMIVWGGEVVFDPTNTGGRYDPMTDTWRPTTTVNAPSARQDHTIVWTGAEAIVWGGENPNMCCGLHTGGRYNPVTDTWTPTNSTYPTVKPLEFHSAVWTGSRMIVWGDDSQQFGAGFSYDPVTDSWTPTSMGPNAPTSREKHVTVWTGKEMIIWGGERTFNNALTSTGGRYDPASDSWTATSTGPNVPLGRTSSAAVWTGQEMIVWGGRATGGETNTGARYDPIQDTWTPTNVGPSTPSPRDFHTAVWAGDQMIVWGGGVHAFNTGGRYFPESDTWISTGMGSTPAARTGHSAIWTGVEMIVWGGSSSSSLNSGGKYNPATDDWTPTSTGPGVPSVRSGHSAVWTGTEMVVWGGSTNGNLVNTGGRYNPITDTWVPTNSGASTPAARYAHSTVWSGSQMIVWGGSTANGGLLNTGGRYDPRNDTWMPTNAGSTAPMARWFHSAVYSNGRMIVWGGRWISVLNSGGKYDPSTDTWTPTSASVGNPAGLEVHAAVATSTGMIVWGGYPIPNHLTTNAGWRYDFASDTWAPTSTSESVPEARDHHTAVGTGTDIIVWGGRSARYLNSGGRYSPGTDTWIPTSMGPNVPVPREVPKAVWTGKEMIVWGGYPLTNTGARYCACPDGRLLYRDADGDGFGDASLSSPICDGQTPAGFSDDNSDCNDASPDVHPGAAEACNGLDENCDGVIDNGGDALCDDGNVCTDDSCIGASGCIQTNNTVSCSDGQMCTVDDSCSGGVCVGGVALICVASDQCHAAGACDPTTGVCNNPIVSEGTSCNDNDLCTTGETCQDGNCTPAYSGLDEPDPRTNGYYKRLCHGPHTGDQLSDTDAECVAQVTATFAGISTAAEVCDVIEPSQPNNDVCGRSEDDLMVLALNICRARVCTAQRIDSQCGSNVNVGQSLAESDAILRDPSRDLNMCSHAKCLDEEINNGQALEMNSLTLNLEEGDVRLNWNPPYVSDGTALPKKYNVWRRVQGALSPFMRLGETTTPTYLDTTSGSDAFEYEVTAVLN